MTEIDRAYEDLKRHRAALWAAVLRTPEGKALARLDAALDALGGSQATNGHVAEGAAATLQKRPESPSARKPRSSRPFTTVGPVSVRTMVLDLMGETGKTMTSFEILRGLEQRGTPVVTANPQNSVRNALWTLTKDGLVRKVGTGKYRAISEVVSTATGGGP